MPLLTLSITRLSRWFAVILALLAFIAPLRASEPPSSVLAAPAAEPPSSVLAAPAPAAVAAAPNVSLAATAASMDTLDDQHLLAIGDVLSFRVVEDLEDPKPVIVAASGDLEVPYVGRFAAKDKTCKQLARELKTELEKEYYFQATVILAVDVLTKTRGKVYLYGAVRLPGPQDIPSDEVFTLSKAIMRAGGFGDFSDKKNVKVTRKSASGGTNNRVVNVNVAEILEKGKTAKDMLLEPDDMIYIPNRLMNF